MCVCIYVGPLECMYIYKHFVLKEGKKEQKQALNVKKIGKVL